MATRILKKHRVARCRNVARRYLAVTGKGGVEKQRPLAMSQRTLSLVPRLRALEASDGSQRARKKRNPATQRCVPGPAFRRLPGRSWTSFQAAPA